MKAKLFAIFTSFCLAQNAIAQSNYPINLQSQSELIQSKENMNQDQELPELQNTTNEPFSDIDVSWQNGSDRRTENIWKGNKYFTPSIFVDVNYTHSFNTPNDNTVVGSTALTRDDEVQLSALHFGGDFNYKGARARFMTQFGTRSTVVPEMI